MTMALDSKSWVLSQVAGNRGRAQVDYALVNSFLKIGLVLLFRSVMIETC